MLRLPNPINPNNSLNAEHVVYVGTTGSAKTTAIRKLGFIKRGEQAIYFDPYSDHANRQGVTSFTSWSEFWRAAWQARKSKAGFRFALVGVERTPEALEKFARIAWALGNGRHAKRLHVVVEELARFTATPSKLTGTSGELWTGGRKFGLVMHTTFQRGQEVPKTVMSESAFAYIGAVGGARDAKYLAEAYDIPADEIKKLKSARDTGGVADYILRSPGFENWKKGKMDARK